MRNCPSGSRSTDRLEQYRSRTHQPGLQIDLPAAHTTVSVMRAAASHLVTRFLACILFKPQKAHKLCMTDSIGFRSTHSISIERVSDLARSQDQQSLSI